MRNIKVDVFKMKNCSCKTTETDLSCIRFDGDRYTPSKNWMHFSCGDFIDTPTKEDQFKTTYQYFESPKVSIVKDGKNIFVGSFEELCEKLSR